MQQEFETEFEKDTQRGKYLTFYIAEEVYALEISQVREIISIMPITSLPEFPDYIKGIVNLRGRVIPVMDMRLRLGRPAADYDSKTCIVIIEINGLDVGLIVDRVSEVAYIEDESVKRAPELGIASENRYVRSIGLIEDNILLILDCKKLFKSDEIETITKVG